MQNARSDSGLVRSCRSTDGQGDRYLPNAIPAVHSAPTDEDQMKIGESLAGKNEIMREFMGYVLLSPHDSHAVLRSEPSSR